MKKYEIADVPGIGDVLLNEDYLFGYKEIIKPEKEVVFYGDEHSDFYGYAAINRERGFKSRLPLLSTTGGWIISSYAGQAALATAFNFGMIGGIAYYSAEIAKMFGRGRAKRRIRKKSENKEIVREKIDLSFIDKILDDSRFMEKVHAYDKMKSDRKEMQKGKKSWFERNFYLDEGEEMKNYRITEIAPIYNNLEDACISKASEGGDNARIYGCIAKKYSKVKEKVEAKSRISNEVDEVLFSALSYYFRKRKKESIGKDDTAPE